MISARKHGWTIPVIFAAAFVFSCAPAWAGGAHVFTSSFGSATSTVKDPEPLSAPSGVAFSEATKEVYVIDTGNDRVERFSSTGAYLGQFNGSDVPGTGAFSSPNAVAVDNDPTSESYGDVYVSDGGHHVIDKFDPAGVYIDQLTGTGTASFTGETSGVAVNTSGDLWVAEPEGFMEFSDEKDNVFIRHEESFPGSLLSMAVDSKDNIFLTNTGNKSIWKFTPGQEGIEDIEEAGFEGCKCVQGIAVQPQSNNVYTDRGTAVAKYPPFPVLETKIEEEFGKHELVNGTGIAATATGTVYVADATANDVSIFKEAPKPEKPVTSSKTTVQGLAATVEGELQGGESNYYFAYNTNGTCTGIGTVKTSLTPATGITTVTAKITGLVAKTKYTFCLIAENQYGQEPGEPQNFETGASAPVIEDVTATVIEAQATIEAGVNPELEPAGCVFQYGTSESYGHETPCATLGEGNKNVPVNATLTGLEANTVYYYRVLAHNKTGEQHASGTFTTEVITPTQVETAPAVDVTATSAKIGGQIDPQGGATYYVEYGPPTCSLNGNPNFAWWLCASKSGEAGPLTGNNLQTVTPIQITGLTPGTTYKYWIVAYNKNGSERGEEATFTTPGITPIAPPSTIAPSITPPTIIPPPVAPAPTISITSTNIKGNTLVVSVRTSVSGTVTITGSGLNKTTKTLPAGTHQLTIPLTKTGKMNAKHHKKTTLQVVLTAGGKRASTSKTVKL
jgi:hypothetical protein